MAVHHVDVDPVGAGRVDRAHFLAEPGEIGGQDRRGDERRGHGDPISGYLARRGQARATKKPSSPPCASSSPGRMRSQPVAMWRHAVGQIVGRRDRESPELRVEEGVDDAPRLPRGSSEQTA